MFIGAYCLLSFMLLKFVAANNVYIYIYIYIYEYTVQNQANVQWGIVVSINRADKELYSQKKTFMSLIRNAPKYFG